MRKRICVVVSMLTICCLLTGCADSPKAAYDEEAIEEILDELFGYGTEYADEDGTEEQQYSEDSKQDTEEDHELDWLEEKHRRDSNQSDKNPFENASDDDTEDTEGTEETTVHDQPAPENTDEVTTPDQPDPDPNIEPAFVTAGEVITKGASRESWLLPAAGGTAVKGKLSTAETWEKHTPYKVTFELPDDIFVSGSDSNIVVYYPKWRQAGQHGVIAVIIKADNGYTYCDFCEFTATDDLSIVYGDADPNVASGGELDYKDNKLGLYFYTPDTLEDYTNRRGYVGNYGAYGDVWCIYKDTIELSL